MVEAGFVEASVLEAGLSASDRPKGLAVKRGDDNSVVVGGSYEKLSRLGVRKDIPWEAQRTVKRLVAFEWML